MASYEKRGSSVRAVVRTPGAGKLTQTFDTMAEAKKWAEGMERKKELGELRRSGSDTATVGELLEIYDEKVMKSLDSARMGSYVIGKMLHDPLAKKRVGEVITHDINEWIQRMLAQPLSRGGGTIKPSTVSRQLNVLSAVFTYAVKDRKWIDVNPCHGARRPEEGQSRQRSLLTSEELSSIRAAAGWEEDPDFRLLTTRAVACFFLGLETGMRSGEILRLRPQDYRRDERLIIVAAVEKGGRKASRSGRKTLGSSRKVPLTARAVEILDTLLKTMPDDQPYIVGISDSQRDALWRKVRDRSGVRDLTFHDSKHEAATRLAKYIDVIALSHAIGTKNLRLLRDTYYSNDAQRMASLLPSRLSDG